VAAAVAQRIEPTGARMRRTLDERALARFPGLYARMVRLGFGISPRSRLRRAFVRHQARSGWAAASRRDWELMLLRYAPDLVYEFNAEFVALGLPERLEGRRAWIEVMSDWGDAWAQLDYTLCFVVDLGDRFLGLGRLEARGAASGVDVDRELAQVIEFRDGLVSRDRTFLNWSEGVAAAGLPADLPARLAALPARAALVLLMPELDNRPEPCWSGALLLRATRRRSARSPWRPNQLPETRRFPRPAVLADSRARGTPRSAPR
jgi:ketosteroid isomerase-like protein